MTNFELVIQLTKQDTQKINQDGMKVAMTKGVHTPGDPHPIWAVFSPFERNSVLWHNEYGVYASPNQVQPETVITASSTLYPASSGVVYPFVDNVFGEPKDSVQPNNYAIENDTTTTLTFGLAQTVTANGSTFGAQPASAITVLPQFRAMFEPTEDISVFLYREVDLGTIIVKTEGPVLTVDMASSPTQTIHYNGSEFVLGPLP